MKSGNLLVINAKNENKQNIPNNSTNSHNQQNNSLNIKLKQFKPSFHMLGYKNNLIKSSSYAAQRKKASPCGAKII
jgi:hypothetical protein